MLELCKNLFYDLNNSHIKYCHWKSNLRLERAVMGQEDLDLLFDSRHVGELTSIFNKNGFKYAQSQYGSIYNGIEDWLGFDYETGKLIHLHVHYKLTTGISKVKQATLLWADYVLNNTIMADIGVKIISPEIELLLLFVRNILKLKLFKKISSNLFGYRFSKHDLEEIEYLKKHVDCNKMLLFAGDLIDRNKALLISDLMCKKNVEKYDLINFRKHCGSFFKDNQNSSYLYANLLFILRTSIYIYRNYLNRKQYFIPIKKTFNHGGRIIAIIGADGTGKTTITQSLLTWLSWKLDTRTVYLGSGDGCKSLLRILIDKASTIRSDCTKINMSNGNKKSSSKHISLRKYIGRNLTCLIHISHAKKNKKLLNKMNIYRNMGGIAIVDRYPQVQIKGIYDGPKVETVLTDFKNSIIKNYLIKSEMKYFKILDKVQPDIVFKLILPPELSVLRKPDHDITEVTRKDNITKTLTYPKSKIYEIDVNRNLKDILLDIKRIAWEAL